jgi:hypothetical protein
MWLAGTTGQSAPRADYRHGMSPNFDRGIQRLLSLHGKPHLGRLFLGEKRVQ